MARVADVDVAVAKEDVEAEPMRSNLLYRVDENPPIPTTLLFGIQQLMVCISGLISMPMVLADTVCAKYVPLARVLLIGTMLFTSGVATLLQVLIGTRLPLIQGGSFAFLPAIVAFINVKEFRCTNVDFYMLKTFPNLTENVNFNETAGRELIERLGDSEWMARVATIQGSLMLASLVQMLIGFTGLIGVLTRFVGPLTIAPLMLLLEISIANVCFSYLTSHWFSVVVVVMLLTTALYLHNVRIPVPTYSRKRGCAFKPQPIFAMFPYLMAIAGSWLLCLILTVADVFEPTAAARTDVRAEVIHTAPWFNWPYPGQWGKIDFSTGLFLGFVAATVASVIESVGDYYACARVCEEDSPPSHSTNRGIFIEGVGCLVSGLLGGCVGVTTYSENIGVIGITGVANRRTMHVAGVLMIVLGVFTKVGAIFATLPDPIVGGILTLSLAMVGGVGLSSVQLLDLRLSRNVAILGFSIMLGLLVPRVVRAHPPDTGSTTVDDALKILFTIDMFVGGICGFFLDNTVPGATRAERGLRSSETQEAPDAGRSDGGRRDIYLLPPLIQNLLDRLPKLSFLPFLPPAPNALPKRTFP